MDFKILDAEYEKLYTAEQKMGILFGVFDVVAIFLSCLGLSVLYQTLKASGKDPADVLKYE